MRSKKVAPKSRAKADTEKARSTKKNRSRSQSEKSAAHSSLASSSPREPQPPPPDNQTTHNAPVRIDETELVSALELLCECIGAWSQPNAPATVLRASLDAVLRDFCRMMKRHDEKLPIYEKPVLQSDPDGKKHTIRNKAMTQVDRRPHLPQLVEELRRRDSPHKPDAQLSLELRELLSGINLKRSENECLEIVSKLRDREFLAPRGFEHINLRAINEAAAALNSLLFEEYTTTLGRFTFDEAADALAQRDQMANVPLKKILPVFFKALGFALRDYDALTKLIGEQTGSYVYKGRGRRLRLLPKAATIDPAAKHPPRRIQIK